MKDRITISVSTINGSKHFSFGKKERKAVCWAAALLLSSSLVVTGTVVYLMQEVGLSRAKQHELENVSSSLNRNLSELELQRQQLEYELDDRVSQLTTVSERLVSLESMLGVTTDSDMQLESRLDVAELNSAVRMAILRSVPNGAPVVKARQSSQFGLRKHPVTGAKRLHRGLDFAVNTGTPIYAPADGVVATVRPNDKGSGNFLRLQHAFGFTSSYSHLKKFAVRSGAFVSKGDLIGYSGNSGLSSGPHLHYEVRFIGRALDPRPFVEWDISNFESIFEEEKKVKWVSLINKVTQQVSMQLQLSSQRAPTSLASSS